ncbi:MAG: glutamate racemase [Flavobacteriales bacterium]
MHRHQPYHPIGVFDSGMGGLSVLGCIIDKLPQYDYLYLGDNARTPYGTRSYEVVYNYTLQGVNALFDKGCHLVILACNTASAKALRTIQQKDLPNLDPGKRVLGVIRPCTESIDRYTKNGHVGILATPGTVHSNSYIMEIEKFHPGIRVTQEACPIWVPLVENKQFDNPGGMYFIRHHIGQLLSSDTSIDTMLLACTHYPILKEQILSNVPDNVNVLTQGEIVALALSDYLKRHPEIDDKCSKNGYQHFLTTENPGLFNEKAKIFTDMPVSAAHFEMS